MMRGQPPLALETLIRVYGSLVPRPHPQKEGKGLAHFEPFLVFADSTVQDPGLPIRLQACDFIM